MVLSPQLEVAEERLRVLIICSKNFCFVAIVVRKKSCFFVIVTGAKSATKYSVICKSQNQKWAMSSRLCCWTTLARVSPSWNFTKSVRGRSALPWSNIRDARTRRVLVSATTGNPRYSWNASISKISMSRSRWVLDVTRPVSYSSQAGLDRNVSTVCFKRFCSSNLLFNGCFKWTTLFCFF